MSVMKIGCIGALMLLGFVLTLEDAESGNNADEARAVVEKATRLDADSGAAGRPDHVDPSDDELWDGGQARQTDPDALQGLIETTMGAYQLTGIFLARETENTAIINGVAHKEGDYLSAFESDFQIQEILEDTVVIRGSLVVGEPEEQLYRLTLTDAQMQQIEEPVDVEPPADWLEEQLSARKQ